MNSNLFRAATKGNRFYWLLGIIEIIVWSVLIKTVGLWWTLTVLVFPKTLILLYQWWRWHKEVKFVSLRLEKIARNKEKQAKSESKPAYQRDWLQKELFHGITLFSLTPCFTSYLVVAFLFRVGGEDAINQAANAIAQREKDKNAG